MATTKELLYVIDHVFLPLKLPQSDDSDYAKDLFLGRQCQAALMEFRNLLPMPTQQHWKWTSSTKMISNLLALRDTRDGAIVGNISNSIAEMDTNDFFALHVRGQNAGLICRNMAEHFSFEAFELSPTTEAVIGTKGRLIRCFPGPAIKLDHERLRDDSFREALAQVLTSLDTDSPTEVYKVVSKSRSHNNIEVRESVHPRFVTEMLNGILRGLGQPYDTNRFYKRTRDDVLWDNTLNPWRRSPFWLLLRVILQTILMASGSAHVEYKSFMVYFMAHVLQLALHQSLPSETLFLMAAKISRRTYKLALGDQQTGIGFVQRVVDATHQELAKRWNTIQHNPDPLGLYKAWKATRSSFLTDTELSLQNLRPYMDRIWTRATVLLSAVEFESACPRRIDWRGDLPELDLACAGGDYSARLSLLDLDLWVQKSLPEWTSANLDSEAACARLSALLRTYATSTLEIYGGDPDNVSLVLLTTMELWIALDKCATHQQPLLKLYSPGFPPTLLHPLLLPKRSQMARLVGIERYLRQRLEDSLHPSSLIFQNTNETTSFAVKYFDQSSAHHELRREIEAAAEIRRAAKKDELAQKTKMYHRLLQESDCLIHEQDTIWDGDEYVANHPHSCRKCKLKREAKNLEISVHEWPLPYTDLEAKSAVFELNVPVAIAEWRDATFTLLEDVFSPCAEANPCNTRVYHLRGYVGLMSYARGKVRRLQLASEAKSFLVAHYGNKKISQAEEKGICVNNGLHYSLYDTTLQRHTSELLSRVDIRRLCTFQLPPGPHAILQYALNDTTHTSNEALSRQDDCPQDYTLHEYYAFVTLRSGHRLQWRNIAREVTARILNFGHYNTHMLVAQAIWHAGPPRATEIPRDSHCDLEEEGFGASLMISCEEALGTVEGSWQGATALRTFVILATRLLSLSPYAAIRWRCYQFLSKARLTSLRWSRELEHLHHDEHDVEQVKRLSLRTLEVALICHSTFDVDEIYHPEQLRSEDDIAAVTECCIIIHDRCPARTDQLDTSLKLLLRGFERTAHLMEDELRSRILQDRSALDRTVKRIWAGYREGSPWTHLPRPNERWLTTQTCADANSSSINVHYNLLDGSLLVNGSPLTRLPQSYELHTTYTRIFGEKVLDVIPSSMPGMIFEIRGDFHGHKVHFRMCDSELIVRIRRQERIYEVIPVSAFSDDFPQSFIGDFVHLLDLASRSIEWRPLNSMWLASRDYWQMRCVGDEYSLNCTDLKLLDVRSPTVQAISSILSPLERATHIHVILNCQTDTLQIRLPRMKLDFFLKEAGGFLESKQLRGMVLDECQSLGTFTGLVNKLVLRSISGSSRCVIIPDGSIAFVPQGHHVEVTISPKAVTHVDYHLYHIDRQLARLIDNGSLHSRLFKLYLHATTSHCLVDELTGRTGTEEALYGLDSAATKSFVALDSGNIELLEMFARLTPRRTYYPKHLHVMQQVKWNTLPSLSQHPGFLPIVASILQQAKSLQIFQEQSTHIPVVDRGDPFLLGKAAIRSSSAHTYGFGADSFTIEHDKVYKARDRGVGSQRELETYQIARLVDSWSQELEVSPRLLAEIESWGEIISGPNQRSIPILGFDVEWLDQPSETFPIYWTSLHDCLSQSRPERDKYRIMMLLSTLSYSQMTKQNLVQTLLAFATVPALRILQYQYDTQLQLEDGYAPAAQTLQSTISGHAKKFKACPEARLENLPNEKKHVADARRHKSHVSTRDNCISAFVDDLVRQGITSNVQTPSGSNYSTYVVVNQAMQDVRPLFQSWHNNCRFRSYVNQLQAILDTLRPKKQDLQRYSFLPPVNDYVAAKAYVDFDHMTAQTAPHYPVPRRQNFQEWVVRVEEGTTDDDRLKDLISHVTDQCSTSHEREYAADLQKSLEAMSTGSSPKLAGPEDISSVLEANRRQAQHDVMATHNCICDHLQAGLHSITRTTQLLPRLSPTAILSHLAHDKITNLPEQWKLSLIRYGITITALQRAERLLAASSNPAALIDELENPGHRGWDPVKHPEWLILEIENNILIREEQAKIAHEMINPSSGSNSIMQMNMGKGKSSVVVPISAIDLANGDSLARIIVLRPLAMQMFQLLVKKLGSMVNRRIVYMPISRSLALDVGKARQIQQMYADCARTGAIILTQPEHILSFELLGLERLLTNPDLGEVMVETQHWLQKRSRDILDESDEILSVKFELVYTMGMQRAVEFSPERWTSIQHVLGILSSVAESFQEEDPHGIEVVPTALGCFPRIRILRASAGATLMNKVAWQLCTVGLPNVNIWSLSLSVRKEIFRFITCTGSSAEGEGVQSFMSTSDFMKQSLLLLRGLFACGVLTFALAQKRWRVNYGLDPTRTRLAVPYHAKDSPAARAEFSHPDVTIVLTCLSYYYGGLDDTQIYASFEALLQSDQAQEEYERWVKDAPDLLPCFQHLTGINLADQGQCSREIFPPLRLSKGLVDFYLAAVVFPAEMKEFPMKLSSSGWDIARRKSYPTTGFSGTNDSRYVLPLSVVQYDLPAQLSTNAAVLKCLLRTENSFVDITEHSRMGFLNANTLLDLATVLDPPVRVILDVGAQVLELQNEAFANAWLLCSPNAQAVIFFDAQNEICVLTRDGRKEPLQVSPFVNQMDQCLVYLDESHTRGTDLKLPDDYRALVTLGPDLTKDRLVQACMRMRKLGRGQSVVFCSSLEVQRKIQEHMGVSGGDLIRVQDVLAWCIAGTCIQTKRSVPLWATQGLRHLHRQKIFSESPVTQRSVESLLEPEAQSLQERYGNASVHSQHEINHSLDNSIVTDGNDPLSAILAKCKEFEIQTLAKAALQEEQERELSPENEREQQVELPQRLEPQQHSVHLDLRLLAVHGTFNRHSRAFQPAFDIFLSTTARTQYEATAWPKDLLVTADFASTVRSTSAHSYDSFVRPVQWILSSKNKSEIIYVILSPYEANELLPCVRQSTTANLHVYSPRLNLSVRTLEDLSFCAITSTLGSVPTPAITTLINLFAGQLYFRSFEDYRSLTRFLGICSDIPDGQIEVALDGFVSPAQRERSNPGWNALCPFEASPIAFVQAVVSLRRKGQSMKFSHLGRVLSGELIPKTQFDNPDWSRLKSRQRSSSQTGRERSGSVDSGRSGDQEDSS